MSKSTAPILPEKAMDTTVPRSSTQQKSSTLLSINLRLLTLSRCSYEHQRKNAQGSALNSNKVAAIVICANLNHWIVLSNINFNIQKYQKKDPGLAFQTDDALNRTKWYFYDRINDNNNAAFCSKVFEKVFPDQRGCILSRIEVHLKTGANDCGLFVYAYLVLLSQ